MRHPHGPRLAWRDGDIVMVSSTTLIGLIAIAGSWFGASGSVSPTHQTVWLNLGIAGFVIFSGGNCLWLLRGRRAIGARRLALISLDVNAPDVLSALDQNQMGEPARRTEFQRVVRADGMTRVHLSDCPLVAGKNVQPATLDDGDLCGVCGS